jgi:Ca2+-binding EF-hand superfamily protein
MMELQDTYLANEIFEMIKIGGTHSPINFEKFLNFVSIISKGSREEKLHLLYMFFDKGIEAKITKEDLKAHIIGTVLSMQGVPFELEEVEKLKQSIAAAPDTEIEQALDLVVTNIFEDSQK